MNLKLKLNFKKIVFLFFFFLSGNFINSYQALAAKTFIYCSEASPSSSGPAISVSGTTLDASAHTVYSSLVKFKLGETTILPSLAEKWEISPDGLSYTFFLRKNVAFHTTEFFKPTRSFNADDAIFSFERQWKKDNSFHLVNGGTYEMFQAMEMEKTLREIIKIDDYTVKFVLNHPEATFLANLAMGFASIYSLEYANQLLKQNQKQKIDFEPVGTGPFIFRKYAKDNLIRYEANKNYFLGAPKIDKLVFSITPDASVRFQKLKTGECHLINEPSPIDILSMKKNPQFLVKQQEGLNVGYLSMNVLKPPLNNLHVRKAINHALNREAYIEAIYRNQAKIATNPIPPTMWSYNEKVAEYEYNPQKSKDLLKKSGIKGPINLELWTLPVSRPYNPNGKKMGEMMQADLAQVGINVKLISYDWSTYLAKSKEGLHHLIQLGWTGDNGDPDNFLGVLLSCGGVKSGSNTARWCHPPFEKLIQEAKRETNQEKRIQLYEEAQKIFKEQAPWVTLAHSIVYKVMSNKVKGFVIDPLGGNVFHQVDL